MYGKTEEGVEGAGVDLEVWGKRREWYAVNSGRGGEVGTKFEIHWWLADPFEGGKG